MPNKSISFKDTYQEQYDFLMSQDNPSQFVCELIKSYMDNEDDFESRVEKVVSNYLNRNIQLLSQLIQPLSVSQETINTDCTDIEDPW